MPVENEDSLLERRVLRLEELFSAIRDNLPSEPIKYFTFPKWLHHPSGERDKFPDVMVNTLQQEEEYKAKGYSTKVDDAEDFFVTKVSQRVEKLLRGFIMQSKLLHEEMDALSSKVNEFYEFLAEYKEDKDEENEDEYGFEEEGR